MGRGTNDIKSIAGAGLTVASVDWSTIMVVLQVTIGEAEGEELWRH